MPSRDRIGQIRHRIWMNGFIAITDTLIQWYQQILYANTFIICTKLTENSSPRSLCRLSVCPSLDRLQNFSMSDNNSLLSCFCSKHKVSWWFSITQWFLTMFMLVKYKLKQTNDYKHAWHNSYDWRSTCCTVAMSLVINPMLVVSGG